MRGAMSGLVTAKSVGTADWFIVQLVLAQRLYYWASMTGISATWTTSLTSKTVLAVPVDQGHAYARPNRL